MGCECRLLVFGGPTEVGDRVRDRVEELEARWTRFRDDSELSRLNRGAGALMVVSPDTYLLVRRSVDAWALTGGAFDPTVLPALRALGYDRSFESLHATDADVTDPRGRAPAPGCGGIELFDDLQAVLLPPGVEIDPGGLGKGLAADLVADEAMAQGATGIAVDLGGDVRVRGSDPENGSWRVALDLPVADPATNEAVLAEGGAVATSGTARRRWRQGDAVHHHLVDPATGRPRHTDLVAVSVVAGEGWWAEALTKAVFASDVPSVWPDLHGARALAVTGDGHLYDSSAMEPTATEVAV